MVNQTEVNLSTCHQDRWHDALFSMYSGSLLKHTDNATVKWTQATVYYTEEKLDVMNFL